MTSERDSKQAAPAGRRGKEIQLPTSAAFFFFLFVKNEKKTQLTRSHLRAPLGATHSRLRHHKRAHKLQRRLCLIRGESRSGGADDATRRSHRRHSRARRKTETTEPLVSPFSCHLLTISVAMVSDGRSNNRKLKTLELFSAGRRVSQWVRCALEPARRLMVACSHLERCAFRSE